ncbi:uncharacterized protein [Macrobrachium rosenbergii]|uniref:uncharacterized protein n=1 Tax=Macrobrachium rosenbergii TaxID=79674 RepID=UPI0034D69560
MVNFVSSTSAVESQQAMIRAAAQSARSPKGSRMSPLSKRPRSKSPVRSPKKVRCSSKSPASTSDSKPSAHKKGFRKLETFPSPAPVGGWLAPFWNTWNEWGAESWVAEVLRKGYRVPFHSRPHVSGSPVHLPSYSPSFIRGIALAEEIRAPLEKGALEPIPPSPGFYSQIFVAPKAGGSWRPIIDLSGLNRFIILTKFHMKTSQSVLRSVRRDNWMISADLKDAYLQVPIHQESRKFLRSSGSTGTFQFRVLCFGLTTAPQVFTRVMSPVSDIMHRQDFWMRRYLND